MNPYNYKKPANAQVAINNTKTPQTMGVEKSVSNSKTDAYLELKIMNAKPEELILMLYDGLVKFISQAKNFNEQNQYDRSNTTNIRAQEILQELRSSLNLEIEISNSLESLYVFMIDHLVEANIQKSNELLDEVLEMAKDLRDTWKTAMNL